MTILRRRPLYPLYLPCIISLIIQTLHIMPWENVKSLYYEAIVSFAFSLPTNVCSHDCIKHNIPFSLCHKEPIKPTCSTAQK